jgi:hypothetical protein
MVRNPRRHLGQSFDSSGDSSRCCCCSAPRCGCCSRHRHRHQSLHRSARECRPQIGRTLSSRHLWILARGGLRCHARSVLSVQLESSTRSRPSASRVRHAREHVRHPTGHRAVASGINVGSGVQARRRLSGARGVPPRLVRRAVLPRASRQHGPASRSEHCPDRRRVVVWQQAGYLGRRCDVLLAFGMVLLGVATFVALIGFISLCDRV